MTTLEGVLVDALRAAGEMTAMLTMALSEQRNPDISEQERTNSTSLLLRRARRLAVQVYHGLNGGIP